MSRGRADAEAAGGDHAARLAAQPAPLGAGGQDLPTEGAPSARGPGAEAGYGKVPGPRLSASTCPAVIALLPAEGSTPRPDPRAAVSQTARPPARPPARARRGGAHRPGEAQREADRVAEGGVGAGTVGQAEGVDAQHRRDGAAVGAGRLGGHAGLVVLETHAEEGPAGARRRPRAPAAAAAVPQQPLLVDELLQLQLEHPRAPDLRGRTRRERRLRGAESSLPGSLSLDGVHRPSCSPPPAPRALPRARPALGPRPNATGRQGTPLTAYLAAGPRVPTWQLTWHSRAETTARARAHRRPMAHRLTLAFPASPLFLFSRPQGMRAGWMCAKERGQKSAVLSPGWDARGSYLPESVPAGSRPRLVRSAPRRLRAALGMRGAGLARRWLRERQLSVFLLFLSIHE